VLYVIMMSRMLFWSSRCKTNDGTFFLICWLPAMIVKRIEDVAQKTMTMMG
jgi:hypothetical protein